MVPKRPPDAREIDPKPPPPPVLNGEVELVAVDAAEPLKEELVVVVVLAAISDLKGLLVVPAPLLAPSISSSSRDMIDWSPESSNLASNSRAHADERASERASEGEQTTEIDKSNHETLLEYSPLLPLSSRAPTRIFSFCIALSVWSQAHQSDLSYSSRFWYSISRSVASFLRRRCCCSSNPIRSSMEDERDRREKYVVLLDIPTTVVSREARIVTDVKYVPPPAPSASISAAAPQAISSSGLVSLSSTPSVPALLTQASDSGVSSLSSSSSSVVFEPPADNAANRSLPHVDIIRSSFEDDAAAATAAAATGAPSTTGEPQGLDQNMLDLSFAEKKLSPRNRSSSLGGAPTPGGPSPSSSSSSGPTEFDNYYVASTRLQKQILYETKTRFYLVGYTKSKHIVCGHP